MKLLLKLLLASTGLLYLLICWWMMTNPGAMVEQFALVPEGIAGLNSLRANAHWWLLPAAALTGSAALGRLIGMAMDGIARESLTGLLFELVIIAIFLLAYRVLGGGVSRSGA